MRKKEEGKENRGERKCKDDSRVPGSSKTGAKVSLV